ncbi:hypothetical protein D3C87_616510 [compost metagenome]
MSILYDWLVEEIVSTDRNDADAGERVDHYTQESAFEALKFLAENTPKEGNHFALVVVRDRFDDRKRDLASRAWAYIKDGVLPEAFLDANHRFEAEVPKYIRKEFDQATQKLAAIQKEKAAESA